MAGTIPFGCGQCLPCRINKRRQWMWRQYLEGLCHEENAFVTLTYSRGHIPGNWQLRPRDLQLFFKRLRRHTYPHKIRYFAVGEYGEESSRPHYHISLFGLSGFTRIQGRSLAESLTECWPYGFVDVQEFNHLTAQYVAGYTVKKLTDRKLGKEWITPEFARMSNRPGIGAKAMETIAATLNSQYMDWDTGDVPSQLQIGKRKIPIGRYLLQKLREEVGFTEEYIKTVRDRKSYERSVELQDVLFRSEGAGTFKAAFLSDIEGQLAQVEARAKLYKKRSTV